MYQARAARVAALLMSITTAGCSLALPKSLTAVESVVGYAARNEEQGVFYKLTPGVDLRLGGGWEGLNVGVSEMGFYGPVTAADGNREHARFSHFAYPLGWTWKGTEGTQRWLGWVLLGRKEANDRVSFIHYGYFGGALELSQVQGAEIGLGRVTVLYAEPSESGVYVLQYSSFHPVAGRLIRRAEEEGHE